MPTYQKPEDAPSDLQTLLLRAVPRNELGNKTLVHLADKMNISKWAIRKWIRKDKLPPDRAKQVVEIGRLPETGGTKKLPPEQGRVQLEDFHPYVYKD